MAQTSQSHPSSQLLPYDDSQYDPFIQHYNALVSMPPSASLSHVTPRIGRSGNSKVQSSRPSRVISSPVDNVFRESDRSHQVEPIRELQESIESAEIEEGLTGVKSWIQCYRSNNDNLDIDRIVRYAALLGKKLIVRYLVEEEGANLHQVDIYERSAIFYATRTIAAHQVLKYILRDSTYRSEPGKLNLVDFRGQTPLHYATRFKQRDCVKLLLRMGAQTDIESMDGETPFDLATAESAILQLFMVEKFASHYPKSACSAALFTGSYGYHQWKKTIRELQDGFMFWDLWSRDLMQSSADILQNNLLFSRWDDQLVNIKDCCLVWIHVPSTNGITVAAIINCIEGYVRHHPSKDGIGSALSDPFYASFRDPSSAPEDGLLNYREPFYESYESNKSNKSNKGGDGSRWECVSIVFPCLALQTIQSQKERRTNFETMTAHVKGNNLDYRKYNVHLERTLDEAYYPGLVSKVLTTRNQDQVVSREFRKMRGFNKDNEINTPILMVPQLWIWSMGNYIISAHSMTKQSALFQYSRRNEKHGGPEVGWRLEVESPSSKVQIGLIIADHIDRFGQLQSDTQQEDVQFPPPLDIFEAGVVRILSDVDEYMNPEDVSTLNILKEREFLHDIADIRSELAMIIDVFDQQDEVLSDLLGDYKMPNKREPHVPKHHVDPQNRLETSEYQDWEYIWKKVEAGWKKVEASKQKLTKYRKRAQKIDKDAERIEKAIQDQLNLKRTHASIRDTRTSIILGTAVIGFTVITIIFAPLAFMTSLFALPLDNFLSHQIKTGGTNTYSSAYIGKWFAVAEVVSLAVTVLAVVASLWLINIWDDRSGGKNDSGGKGQEKLGMATKEKPKTKLTEKLELNVKNRLRGAWRSERRDTADQVEESSKTNDIEKGRSSPN